MSGLNTDRVLGKPWQTLWQRPSRHKKKVLQNSNLDRYVGQDVAYDTLRKMFPNAVFSVGDNGDLSAVNFCLLPDISTNEDPTTKALQVIPCPPSVLEMFDSPTADQTATEDNIQTAMVHVASAEGETRNCFDGPPLQSVYSPAWIIYLLAGFVGIFLLHLWRRRTNQRWRRLASVPQMEDHGLHAQEEDGGLSMMANRMEGNDSPLC